MAVDTVPTSSSDMPSYEDELALVSKIAVQAGDIALPYFHGDVDLAVELKEGNSPVSAADHAVNAYLHEHLIRARPTYGWLSEETEDADAESRTQARRTFVVDPIDGTRGFIQGRDMWCVSVAIVENGLPIAGVLVCPARDELFSAIRGGGAFLNQKSIRLKNATASPLTIGGPRVFIDALDDCIDDEIIRHPHVPSLAYRIAKVATGHLDATFVKANSHDWDIAAAGLILAEAGGALVDPTGNSVPLNQARPKQPMLVATHPALKDKMLGIVQQSPFS